MSANSSELLFSGEGERQFSIKVTCILFYEQNATKDSKSRKGYKDEDYDYK